MTKFLIPGSFDPITIGHVDLIERAARLCDELVVAIGINSAKTYAFDQELRARMVRAAVADVPGVVVTTMDSTLVDCATKVGADLVVKGIRHGSDLDWEFTQANVNREIGGVETLFLPTRPDLAHVSSTVVRELRALGLDTSRYVPAAIRPLMTDNNPN